MDLILINATQYFNDEKPPDLPEDDCGNIRTFAPFFALFICKIFMINYLWFFKVRLTWHAIPP
jgi:hypothetical protein